MSTQTDRKSSMESYMVRIYTGKIQTDVDFTSVEADKDTSSLEIVHTAVSKLKLGENNTFELAEVFCSGGQLCKERRLESTENPVRVQLLWPKSLSWTGRKLETEYRFYIRHKEQELLPRVSSWKQFSGSNPVDNFLSSFLEQPLNKEYQDLCNLPHLNEKTLLDNLRARFRNGNIYTYVGSILISVNPFKFYPIYNPKYVKLYQNKCLGDLPPHIFAIADSAFHTMLKDRSNQCIVISGESGSGKTESTNLLLHHLTALSQKGTRASGVEQTVLSAGPVLEAFGNARTVHNNNSSRFGKFIQVNYKENGMVHGAVVEQYLLEKSRIVSQASNERNYHVFYYLLVGASDCERRMFHLEKAEDFFYLNQNNPCSLEDTDEQDEFRRLQESMEMVGFSTDTQRRLFAVLSAVLHLGNVAFKNKHGNHHDEAVAVQEDSMNNVEVVSNLLKVKEATLVEVLSKKKTVAGGETVVIPYKKDEAQATRDAMAKCLYGALFDWIVLQVNRALITKRDTDEHSGNSIGVLDIFGFEDFTKNSFEQFCINYANEHLQYYFNQHIFKFEQEEYEREGIKWDNIEFIDNTGCLDLFAKKPHGLFSLLDEECNFPGATNSTLLAKFNQSHNACSYYESPQVKESAFLILHYAGPVKYSVTDFREKNSDLMRPDIVRLLKSSSLAFVRELVGSDPLAVLRWAIVRAFFRSYFAFKNAGKRYRSDESKVKRRKSIPLMKWGLQHSSSDTALNDFFHVSLAYSVLRRINVRGTSDPASSMHDTVNKFRALAKENVGKPTRKNHRKMSRERLIESVENEHSEQYIYSPSMLQANKVLMKNKSFKPKSKGVKRFRDLRSMKYVMGQRRCKKQPPSVGTQFQQSLSDLMQTLNLANPFFVRCIKSNNNKAPCQFDEDIILRQLRYTGMLATVKIRQSGYNYRLLYEEFILQYKLLLPKGLLSSKEDVAVFLHSVDLNRENYQIGKTKIFFREAEKVGLDGRLHQAIMTRIVRIQKWMKSVLIRKQFIRMRLASRVIQGHVRGFLARRQFQHIIWCSVTIQKWYRMFKARKVYDRMVNAAIKIQANYRTYAASVRYQAILKKHKEDIVLHLKRQKYLNSDSVKSTESQELSVTYEDNGSGAEDHSDVTKTNINITPPMKSKDSSTSLGEELQLKGSRLEDHHSLTSDEGILANKESSNEDLDFIDKKRDTDDESSGVSDTETTSLDTYRSIISTPPMTPTSPDPSGSEGIKSMPLGRSTSRVKEMLGIFQNDKSPEDKDVRPQLSKSLSVGSIQPVRPTLPHKRPTAPLDESQIKLDDLMSTYPPMHDTGEDVWKKRVIGAPVSPPVDQTEAASPGLLHRSPLRNVGRRFKNIIGKKFPRKDGEFDTDEETLESPQPKRPNELTINFPRFQKSPKSPRKERTSLRRGDWTLPEDEHASIPETRQKKKHYNKKLKAGDKSEWKVREASQWHYPNDMVIGEINELKAMSSFIYSKSLDLPKDGAKGETAFDRVFKKAMNEFHRNLISATSVAMQDNHIPLKYRDLLTNFEQTFRSMASQEGQDENTFPVTLGVNAFRGFLDEFRQKGTRKKENYKAYKKMKKKKPKDPDFFEFNGHKFVTNQFNIPTFCEVCGKMMWKGHCCQVCRMACHKRCSPQYSLPCKSSHTNLDRYNKNDGPIKVFGYPLFSICKDVAKVPCIIEKIIVNIETRGLYTIGLYRKSGSAARAKQLMKEIDEATDKSTIDFDQYKIHDITMIFKSFLRDLPEPLLTFELYDDFLRAAELQNSKDRIQSLVLVIDKLPTANFCLFERLMFHLARVAVNEDANKMNPHNLAVVFAPCILKTNKNLPAQETLMHVSKLTVVVKHIIEEQVLKVKNMLKDIDTLESAKISATDRLTEVRASMRTSKAYSSTRDSTKKFHSATGIILNEDLIDEQSRLVQDIETYEHEKESLTSKLPMLEFRQQSSDDDVLSTDNDLESMTDSQDDLDLINEEFPNFGTTPKRPPRRYKRLHSEESSVSQTSHASEMYSDSELESRRTTPVEEIVRASSNCDIKEVDTHQREVQRHDEIMNSKSHSKKVFHNSELKPFPGPDDEIMV